MRLVLSTPCLRRVRCVPGGYYPPSGMGSGGGYYPPPTTGTGSGGACVAAPSL
jgi:hypothetical protein